MKLFLTLFLLLLPSAQAETFMLAEPIRQTVETPRSAVASVLTFDLVWTSASTYGIYQVTGEPIAAAAYFGFGMVEGIPTGNVYIQSLNRAIAQRRNRGTLKKIAGLDGVKEIRVLNTGHIQQTGLYSSTLHSSSFVFIETGGTSTPPAVDGREWIPLRELPETKIRFTLQLPDGSPHPSPLVIPLKELFAGSGGDQAVLASWRQSVLNWQKSLGFMDRYIRQKGVKDLKLNSELLIRGESFPLGEFAHGKGVKKIVGLNLSNKLKAWIAGKELQGRENWTTRNLEVLRKGGCRTWFKRLLGKQILLP